MDERKKQAINEMEARLARLQKSPTTEPVQKVVEKPTIISNVLMHDVHTKLMGVIESNGQVIRNESGQAKHKEFTGVYEPKPLKMPPVAPDYPAVSGEIPKTEDYPKSRPVNYRSVIGWGVFLIIVAVAVFEIYLFSK